MHGPSVRVRTIEFKLFVACAAGAFFGAFATDKKRLLTQEPGLIADGDRTDINLQVRAAPAQTQVHRDLRKLEACAGRAFPAGLSE
jgi:hypothetical protein